MSALRAFPQIEPRGWPTWKKTPDPWHAFELFKLFLSPKPRAIGKPWRAAKGGSWAVRLERPDPLG
jgi:hypothetical protein